jgi:pentatricopeptide repeat protein
MALRALIAMGRVDEVGLFLAKAVANHRELMPSLRSVIETVATPTREISRQKVLSVLRDIVDQAQKELEADAVVGLLLAFARLNDEPRVSMLLQHLITLGVPATRDTLSTVARGFLACKNSEAAMGYLHLAATSCQSTASPVAPDLIVSVARCATETSIADDDTDMRPRAWNVLELLEGLDGVPREAFVSLLEWAARQRPADAALAKRSEVQLRSLSCGDTLPSGAYDALVRVHADAADDCSTAIGFFDELAGSARGGQGPSEGSLVGMISACLESQNATLAEHMLRWSSTHGRCTMPVFSATVKVMAVAKKHEQLCCLYDIVDSASLEPDEAVFGQLIKSAVQAGKLDLARLIFGRARNPDVQNCMSLIRACGQEGDLQQALKLLHGLCDRGEADTSAYNCTLDVCVSCGDIEATQSLFEEMRTSGNVDAVSYNILLKQPVNTEGGSSAQQADAVLEEMSKGGLRPNIATYNSIISSAVATGDFDRAWQTVELMECGQGVDAYTLSIVFKGYRRAKQIMDTKTFDRTMGLIRKYKVSVDEVLVNVALEACSCLRDPARLAATLETLVGRGGWALPRQCGMHTYGTLIKAFGQSRQLNRAWQLWQEITVQRGLVATEQLYGQMIDVLVSAERLDDALVLFAAMKDVHKDRLESQGFSVAYAMIVRGYARRNESAKALQCYEEMKSQRVKCGLVVFNTLIDACCRVGDMDGAAQLFTDMVDQECVPDVITYSTLIKGYCVCGELDKALELFGLMRKKDIKPDAIVFNSLLDGCAKQQLPQLCEQVIRDMVDAGVSPSNYSASILIKLHGRCHDVDAAFRVIEEYPQKYGFRPNMAVYTCLMATCIGNNRLDLAMDLRVRMVQEGILPDNKTYSTLLRGTLKAGSVEQCVLTVRAALEQGGRCLLDEELVQSVLSLIQRRRVWEVHGADLMERLRAAGLSVQTPREQPRQQQHHQHQRQQQQGSHQCGAQANKGSGRGGNNGSARQQQQRSTA